MVPKKRLMRMLPALLIALAPAAALAQQAQPNVMPRPLPEEAQVLIAEMQQIHNRLRPIQEQAMQDPAIRVEGESLGAVIRKAMEEVEPATPELIARLNALAPQVEAAQAARDQERFVTLITEAGEIDQILQIARAEAVERPDVLAQVEAFEAKVHTRMIASNPDAAGLLSRLEELNGQLAVLLR